jgi:hypothetical protein
MAAVAFAEKLHASRDVALDEAQALADLNDSPCGVWERDGWFTACVVAPELIEPDPELAGWSLYTVVDPWSAGDNTIDPLTTKDETPQP